MRPTTESETTGPGASRRALAALLVLAPPALVLIATLWWIYARTADQHEQATPAAPSAETKAAQTELDSYIAQNRASLDAMESMASELETRIAELEQLDDSAAMQDIKATLQSKVDEVRANIAQQRASFEQDLAERRARLKDSSSP